MWSFVRQYAKPREVVNEFAKISVFCDFVASAEADNTQFLHREGVYQERKEAPQMMIIL